MKDKLVIENILLLLKGTAEVYVHGTEEASNKAIHEVLYSSLQDILKMQFEVYNKMTEYNWYQIENIKPEEINKTIKNLQNKESN